MTQANPSAIDPSAIKSLAEFVRVNARTVNITQAHPDLVKEIQTLLKIEADGKAGPITRQAFSEFKQDNNLAFPLDLGVTTAKELLELKDTEEAASNDEDDTPDRLNPNAGTRTGRSMRLPTGETVFANQFVVPGIALTWGELTKDCTRVPTAKEYVENAVRLSRTWGEVRDKFGAPLKITSGYRPPKVNRAVGGVSNSQHIYFRAIDMKPTNGDFRKLWDVIKASKFTGLGDAVFSGKNKGFFHVDVRPGSRKIFNY